MWKCFLTLKIWHKAFFPFKTFFDSFQLSLPYSELLDAEYFEPGEKQTKHFNRGKAMSDDKKGERKGIRLNEDHERGGNSGFQVVVVKYKSSWHWHRRRNKLFLRQRLLIQWILWAQSEDFSINKIACSLSKFLRMETKEDMEAIMEKIPKGKAEMELKVVAR